MRLRMVRPNNQQTQELVGDYVQATMTEGMDDAIPSPRSIMVGFVGTSGHSADPVGYLDSGGRLGKVIHTTRHTAHRQPFSGKHACPRRSSSTTLSTLQTTNRWSGTTTFCPTRQVEIVGILCRCIVWQTGTVCSLDSLPSCSLAMPPTPAKGRYGQNKFPCGC